MMIESIYLVEYVNAHSIQVHGIESKQVVIINAFVLLLQGVFILKQYYNIEIQMSLAEFLDQFKETSRVIVNEKYIGDKGAKDLAKFLEAHGKVELLELKHNDITGAGFAEIFKALLKNPGIRQVLLEHNNLGEQGEETWPHYFSELIEKSPKIERLNISNNHISGATFSYLIDPISQSRSLKLLEIRYNQIPTSQINNLTAALQSAANQTLLFVELTDSKIERDAVNRLESYLKNNRKKNPIPKDNLMMSSGLSSGKPQHFGQSRSGFHSQASFSRNNAIDDMSKQNILRHLQNLRDQSRYETTEMKNRLESELSELQKREKLDATEIIQLDRKCNELTISNRNLNYEVERTILEHKQIQQDQEFQSRIKEERILQANRELNEMQSKYEEIQNKMSKDHEAKLKESARVWESRLRSVEDRIRNIETDSNTVDNQVRKISEKREKLRVDYEEEETLLRSRIEQEETQRYKFRLQALKSKISEAELSRAKFHKRGQDILYQFQSNESQGLNNISRVEQEVENLKSEEKSLVDRNKDFVKRNENIKHEIGLKNISVEKLEQELNKIIQEMELRKIHNKQQVDKVILDHEEERLKRASEKQVQIQRIGDLEALLRNYKLENAKLEQEYKLLEHKLQVSLSKAVQEVFSETSLY